MIASNVEAHIHFRHAQDEVKALAAALIPMREYIARVAKPDEKASLTRITTCAYFRAHEAKRVYLMLLRSVKFARAHLDEYFESMRREILINAQLLETEATTYWESFQEMVEQTTTTH